MEHGLHGFSDFHGFSLVFCAENALQNPEVLYCGKTEKDL
jgi:hypothetical protein